MWVDKGLYWSLVGSSDSEPEEKTIYYTRIKYPDGMEMKIANAVRTGDTYKTVNSSEIQWHLNNGAVLIEHHNPVHP